MIFLIKMLPGVELYAYNPSVLDTEARRRNEFKAGLNLNKLKSSLGQEDVISKHKNQQTKVSFIT